MDVIGYLIVLSAVGLAAAVMAGPAAQRAATTDSDTASKREAQVRDADLWGNCSPCRRWFALDMAAGSSWDCPGCQCEPKQIVNRRLQPLPADEEGADVADVSRARHTPRRRFQRAQV